MFNLDLYEVERQDQHSQVTHFYRCSSNGCIIIVVVVDIVVSPWKMQNNQFLQAKV